MRIKFGVYWLGILVVTLICAGELLFVRMAAAASGWDLLGVIEAHSRIVR